MSHNYFHKDAFYFTKDKFTSNSEKIQETLIFMRGDFTFLVSQSNTISILF